jgi:hypothetical protein
MPHNLWIKKLPGPVRCQPYSSEQPIECALKHAVVHCLQPLPAIVVKRFLLPCVGQQGKAYDGCDGDQHPVEVKLYLSGC